MFVVETCIAFVINSVPVKEMLRDMFKNILCNDISLNYEVKNPHSVDKRNEYCNNGTQVHFVRTVYNGNNYNEFYCGNYNIISLPLFLFLCLSLSLCLL